MQDLTLVIPAKYESESLPIFLEEISNLTCKKLVILEETDNKTIQSIKNFERIELIFQKNKGYGAALLEGIRCTQTKFFCIINADGSMNPKYLANMLNKTKINNLDFLFASRYEKHDSGSDDDNIITYIGNYIFTKIGNIFFSLKITDILFTYVLGKTNEFNSLNLTSYDFTLCVEFPIKANRYGFKLSTIPSYERSRIGGKKKVNAFKDGLLILIKMIKLFFIK
jgi:glycosyltransferase involved in cell wall biosynthesis